MPIPAHLQPHLVRIELLAATGKDNSGGTTTGETVLADRVPCLISMGSGRPDQRFEQQAGNTRYRVSGGNPNLARMDVRIVVLAGPPRVGAVLKVVGVSGHGPGVLIGKFYRAECEEFTAGL